MSGEEYILKIIFGPALPNQGIDFKEVTRIFILILLIKDKLR